MHGETKSNRNNKAEISKLSKGETQNKFTHWVNQPMTRQGQGRTSWETTSVIKSTRWKLCWNKITWNHVMCLWRKPLSIAFTIIWAIEYFNSNNREIEILMDIVIYFLFTVWSMDSCKIWVSLNFLFWNYVHGNEWLSEGPLLINPVINKS